MKAVTDQFLKREIFMCAGYKSLKYSKQVAKTNDAL
jgi:hypothetical protein